MKLLQPYRKNGLELKNRIVMAPMTRSRAINNIPNELMALYYAQRTGAGLIITEGTAPLKEALGYPRIPGIFNEDQIKGWKLVTDKVHSDDTKIFVQLMHTGRIGHNDNLPEGEHLVGPSDITASGTIFTDTLGIQDFSRPKALDEAGIAKVKEGFITAANNAVEAGFDGIEIHAANGYLLEQFLNPNVNTRTDAFGGNFKNRTKLTLEIVKDVIREIGANKLGIRFSPFSTLGDLQHYDEKEVENTYLYLAAELNKLNISYLHFVTSPQIKNEMMNAIRNTFDNTLILSSGFTSNSAENAIQENNTDLVAFGKVFIANPDLIKRIELGAPLNQPDFTKLYTEGPEGYTDYKIFDFVK